MFRISIYESNFMDLVLYNNVFENYTELSIYSYYTYWYLSRYKLQT